MSINALLHNVTTAIGDADLIGDSLMLPARKCVDGYRYVFSNADCQQDQRKVFHQFEEVFKRSLTFLASTLAIVPSTGLSGIGAVSKLTDLYRKFNGKVCKSSEVSDYIPMILKPFSRTGDRATAYLRAKVVSEEAGMPLYYKPFVGSEIFAFHQMEKNRGPKYYRRVVYLNTFEQIQNLKSADKTQSVLYLVPFAPFNRDLERECESCSLPKYQPDWAQHQDILKGLLCIESEKLDLPEDAYTIALHVRDGGDYDDDNTKTLHPMKLPSLNFYTGELIKVIDQKIKEGQSRFFVHIFTDAVDPEKIHKQICDQIQLVSNPESS